MSSIASSSEREPEKENKPEKVIKKRGKLERKVETAYSKFNEKVAAVDARSDEKRERILSKERGDGRGREERRGPDEGRDPVNGRGQDRGRTRHTMYVIEQIAHGQRGTIEPVSELRDGF